MPCARPSRRSRASSCRAGGRARRRPPRRSCRPRRGSSRRCRTRRSGRRRRSTGSSCRRCPRAPPELTLTRSVVPRLAVAHEDVRDAVGVAGDEVRGDALERDVAAVGGDRGIEAVAVARRAARAGALALGLPRPASRTKTSEVAVRVARDEVRARRSSKATKRPSAEIDAVAGWRRSPCAPARVEAHALGRAGLAVADEDVASAVRVAGDEVRRRGWRTRRSGRRRRSRGRRCAPLPCGPARVDADALGRARLAVADEDVDAPFVSPGDEVRGGALEGDEAAVGGDRGRARWRRSPCAPAESTLTRSVVPPRRSRTKTSVDAVRVAGERGWSRGSGTRRSGRRRRSRDASQLVRSPAPRPRRRSRARSCPRWRSRTKTSVACRSCPRRRGSSRGCRTRRSGRRRRSQRIRRSLPFACALRPRRRSRARSCRRWRSRTKTS